MGTLGTLRDASTLIAARLGAERSPVQIRPPRLRGSPLRKRAFGFKACHMSPQMVPWYQSWYQAAKAWIWGTKGREFKFSTGQLFECISDSSDVGAVVVSVQ